jgi:hypothetical protein
LINQLNIARVSKPVEYYSEYRPKCKFVFPRFLLAQKSGAKKGTANRLPGRLAVEYLLNGVLGK